MLGVMHSYVSHPSEELQQTMDGGCMLPMLNRWWTWNTFLNKITKFKQLNIWGWPQPNSEHLLGDAMHFNFCSIYLQSQTLLVNCQRIRSCASQRKKWKKRVATPETDLCITSVSSGVHEPKCILQQKQNRIYCVDSHSRSYLYAFKACQHRFQWEQQEVQRNRSEVQAVDGKCKRHLLSSNPPDVLWGGF